MDPHEQDSRRKADSKGSEFLAGAEKDLAVTERELARIRATLDGLSDKTQLTEEEAAQQRRLQNSLAVFTEQKVGLLEWIDTVRRGGAEAARALPAEYQADEEAALREPLDDVLDLVEAPPEEHEGARRR